MLGGFLFLAVALPVGVKFAHRNLRAEAEAAARGSLEPLRIEDLRTGHVGFLDPLELECLAWATKDELAPLLDPAATRWKSVTGDDLELPGDAPAN